MKLLDTALYIILITKIYSYVMATICNSTE